MQDRPKWRYVWIRGWNYLAIAWVLVGLVAGAAASSVLTAWNLATTRHHYIVAVVVGLAIIVADAVCRLRDRHSTGVSRFISPDAGGAILVVPSWLLGVGIVVTGAALIFGWAAR
jgi:hypothetical protein